MNPNASEALAKWREEQKLSGKTIVKETNPIIKLAEKPTSRPLAIKAMCAQCMGCTDQHIEPGWRQSVKNCDAYKCPLYNFRIGAKKL